MRRTWREHSQVRGKAVAVMHRDVLAAGRIGHSGDAICCSVNGEVMESSNDSRLPMTVRDLDGDGALDGLYVQTLVFLLQRVTSMDEKIAEIHEATMTQRVEKEWYNTTELAEALGKSQFTVQERWCNGGRIECEKDEESGKWRIPGDEYRRLVGGGELKPKRR